MTVLWTPPPCDLPAIPRAPLWGGVPQYDALGDETGYTLITRDGLAELGGYLVAVRNWMTSAASCLAVKP